VRVTEHGTMYEVYLGNAYDEYVAAAPTQRPGIIARYASLNAGKDIAPPTADEWKQLLPKLMPRRERELLMLRFKSVQNLMQGITISDGLFLELAIDMPQTIRMVSASDLSSAGMTESDAFALATKNLLERSHEPWTRLVPGLYQSPWADFFDGARLALPSLFQTIGVRGDPIVVLPNRCAMLLTGSEEHEGLKYLYAATRMLAEQERPLHLAALRLVDGKWRPLGDADLDLVQVAPEVLFLSSLQDALDHEVLGGRIAEGLQSHGFHVEPLHAIDDEGTPLMTATKLTATERTVIPRADLVLCASSDGKDVALAWYKVAAILGDELVPVADVWPPHFEARRVPTDTELAAAKALAKSGPT
jgi:hypothetical protein